MTDITVTNKDIKLCEDLAKSSITRWGRNMEQTIKRIVILTNHCIFTHRSTDVTDDGVILGRLHVVRVPQRRVDLLPALPLQLLHASLHLRLSQVALPCPCPLSIEGVQPVLVNIVEVVGAHLLSSEHHRGHLVGLHLVAAAGVHADQLLGEGEPVGLG